MHIVLGQLEFFSVPLWLKILLWSVIWSAAFAGELFEWEHWSKLLGKMADGQDPGVMADGNLVELPALEPVTDQLPNLVETAVVKVVLNWCRGLSTYKCSAVAQAGHNSCLKATLHWSLADSGCFPDHSIILRVGKWHKLYQCLALATFERHNVPAKKQCYFEDVASKHQLWEEKI